MPSLAQLFANVNQKTFFSRPDEIYAALEEAGFKVFTATLKEFSGFFLKFDTSTVVLTPGTQQYAMPPDLGNLVHIAERITATQNWQRIDPESIGDAMDNLQSTVGWDWSPYSRSPFRFYGPFLPEITVGVAQTQQILISPAIDTIRMCELAYTAKWLPIVNSESLNTLPNEGTYAQESFAIAEILRANNDSAADGYETKGQRQLTDFPDMGAQSSDCEVANQLNLTWRTNGDQKPR